MKILGLSGSTHDSAAALVIDGEISGAIEEERVCRVKKAPRRLPILAAKTILNDRGIDPKDIDEVAYFIDPEIFNKQVYGHVIRDWRRYVLHPRDYRTLKFIRRGKRYEDEARHVVRELGIKAPLTFVKHHLGHAASAFLLSPFEKAMILSIDNMGELDSTMLAYGSGKEVVQLGEQRIPHSLGMLYAMITDYLGFLPWSDEGKVMALAAYGYPTIPIEDIVNIENGRFEVQRPYQMIETLALDRLYSDLLVKKLGPPRKLFEPVTQRHKDIAASVQHAVEKVAKNLVTWLYERTGMRKLCLAGGVALNCKMNGSLYDLPFIDDMYVFPAAGDAGASLGAAIHVFTEKTQQRPKPLLKAGIGREFSNEQIEHDLDKYGLSYVKSDDPALDAASYLMNEDVIAWFQEKSEFGPRALGHRSILALPNKSGVKDHVNQYVKERELWRPLCPSVLGGDAEEYFLKSSRSLFMNVTHYARGNAQEKLPEIFHVDGTARVHAVYGEESETYQRLLETMKNENGYPILINTSFNRRGEPIVDSPEDAIRSYMQMPIRTMVIGNYLVHKSGGL